LDEHLIVIGAENFFQQEVNFPPELCGAVFPVDSGLINHRLDVFYLYVAVKGITVRV